MAFSLPGRQSGPIESVLTAMNTNSCILDKCWIRSTAMMLALQSIPARLKNSMSTLNLEQLIIQAVREGAGDNNGTITTSKSICDGETCVLEKSLSNVSKMILSLSKKAYVRVGDSSHATITVFGQ